MFEHFEPLAWWFVGFGSGFLVCFIVFGAFGDRIMAKWETKK